jgi:hypothetical protein
VTVDLQEGHVGPGAKYSASTTLWQVEHADGIEQWVVKSIMPAPKATVPSANPHVQEYCRIIPIVPPQ